MANTLKVLSVPNVLNVHDILVKQVNECHWLYQPFTAEDGMPPSSQRKVLHALFGYFEDIAPLRYCITLPFLQSSMLTYACWQTSLHYLLQ